MAEDFPEKRKHLQGRGKQRGFTLLELIVVAVIVVTIAAIAIPSFIQTLRNFRISGDARSINGEILMAKMRAAARFTQTRVYFDLGNNLYRTEFWDKDNLRWQLENVGAPQNLSSGVTFGAGGVANGPNGNPIAISAECKDDTGLATPGGGDDIVDTACILFNSRGIPITPAGTPTATHAVYINDPTAVFGVTLSATGLSRVWRIDAADTAGSYWNIR